ncbi:hypothetical protein GIB67_019910, partial [Kingdonia uniflora]
YTMNEKAPPTASNRRKKELAIEGDLLIYKRKRKIIDPSTVVPPNIVDTANEGVSEPVPPTESAQAALGAQAERGATNSEDEKLPIRVHHHQSTWDLKKEPQVVYDFVKLKGLDIIGAISYNSYNSTLISTFAEHWQSETNSFRFKWGEMTPTLDDVEQLVRLPADGDATVIGGTWGFLALLKIFQNNLLQDLNAFKSLKAGGVENSLSLKKLKEHYAYKLEKVLSDGTAAAAKKKGLTDRSVARTYMLYLLGSFLFATKRAQMSAYGTLTCLPRTRWQRSSHGDQQFWPTCITILVQHLEMIGGNLHAVPRYSSRRSLHISQSLLGSPRRWTLTHASTVLVRNGTYLLRIDMVEFILKEADRGRRVREGPLVCTEGYLEWFVIVSWTAICPITVDMAADDDVRIHQKKEAIVNEHGDTPVYQSEDVVEQYDASHHEHASLSSNAHNTIPTRGRSGSFDQQIITLNGQLQKLKEDKEESEANINL